MYVHIQTEIFPFETTTAKMTQIEKSIPHAFDFYRMKRIQKSSNLKLSGLSIR